MSDGITLCCPRCGKYTALKKEYDELRVRILKDKKHEEYDTHLPVYTCQDEDCGMRCVIEFMVKPSQKTGSEGKGK